MKKSVLILSVLLLFSVILTGCGSKAKSDLEGTKWALTGGEAEGFEVSAEAMGMTDFTIEFKEDGKCTVSLFGETQDGTFKDKDNEVTIEMDGDEMTAKLADDKLTMEQDGTTLTFEKQ